MGHEPSQSVAEKRKDDSDKAQMAQAMAVNQPKALGRGARIKASQYSYNQGKNQGTILKFSRCFFKDLKSKSR